MLLFAAFRLDLVTGLAALLSSHQLCALLRGVEGGKIPTTTMSTSMKTTKVEEKCSGEIPATFTSTSMKTTKVKEKCGGGKMPKVRLAICCESLELNNVTRTQSKGLQQPEYWAMWTKLIPRRALSLRPGENPSKSKNIVSDPPLPPPSSSTLPVEVWRRVLSTCLLCFLLSWPVDFDIFQASLSVFQDPSLQIIPILSPTRHQSILTTSTAEERDWPNYS